MIYRKKYIRIARSLGILIDSLCGVYKSFINYNTMFAKRYYNAKYDFFIIVTCCILFSLILLAAKGNNKQLNVTFRNERNNHLGFTCFCNLFEVS